ncbi:glutamine synthetase/guanido kinase [Ascobolus immersus RN42]|uniref:Glutamine synthetase/guanido kinase n=1 Tax=Ascobolus immersus RN42 TaxID=1160509 RepID=A0A3N4HQU0_ASCIM|nr:glutamine synthetase/guanido kinase [Ascobolus immersus RN42]
MTNPGLSDTTRLKHLVNTIPIIDNHCHPIFTHLQTSEPKEGPDFGSDDDDGQVRLDLRAMVTEANGPAMNGAQHTLASFRAVKQLATLLDCEASWDSIEKARKNKNFASWAKRCFEGTHCLLIDDLLFFGAKNLETEAHGKFVEGGVKRIVRIEAIAEKTLLSLLYDGSPDQVNFMVWRVELLKQLEGVGQRPDVVGFKSAVCYRTGLSVEAHMTPPMEEYDRQFMTWVDTVKGSGSIEDRSLKARLNTKLLNDLVVNLACSIASKLQKPIQFHTGFGDNELTLSLADPSLLQPLIHANPSTKFVLLHASYPFTRQAGYLASVYENVYLDFGLIFPMISADGQIEVFRQILELCPTNKLLWSSDSLRYPEQYYIANLQGRETVSSVLANYLEKGYIDYTEASKIAKLIFFENSNELYKLDLSLNEVLNQNPEGQPRSTLGPQPGLQPSVSKERVHLVEHILPKGLHYFRIQWVDYTGSLRLRVLPRASVLELLRKPVFDIRVTQATLSLLQDDTPTGKMNPSGMFRLQPSWSDTSIRKFWPVGLKEWQKQNNSQEEAAYATVMCSFSTTNPDEPLSHCPRNTLYRAITLLESKLSANIQLGFETEIVFLKRTPTGELSTKLVHSHGWSQSTCFTPELTILLEEIVAELEASGIKLIMYHPESSDGQFEFVTSHLPAMEAIDALYHTRLITQTAAERHGYRATLHPKPYARQAGTAAHVHFSLNFGDDVDVPEQERDERCFAAGILNHLEAICAFSMPTPASYRRLADGVWAGGTWIAYGDENREVPLRRCLAGDETGGKDHWELRCIDGTANMYLVIAALIFAGLDGVDKGTELGPGCQVGEIPAKMSKERREELGIVKRVPSSLEEALDCLKGDDVLGKALGMSVVETLVDVKEAEIEKLVGIEKQDGKESQWRWEIERY